MHTRRHFTSASPQRLPVVLGLALALGVVAMSATSCGYSVTSNDPNQPRRSHHTTVAVEPFRNFTDPYEPGVELRLHDELLQALIVSSYDVDARGRANLFVTGVIREFRRGTLSRDLTQIPTEINLSVIIDITVYARGGGRWSDTITIASEPFAVPAIGTLTETFGDAAGRAIRRAAREIVDALVPPHRRW